MSEKELVLPADYNPRLKQTTKAKQYETFADSEQKFDGIGLIDVCNGDLVLRGRHGMRDMVLPIKAAWNRFFHSVNSYISLRLQGRERAYEFGNVILDMGHKIAEAVQYRMSGGPTVKPMPDFINNQTLADLYSKIKMLEDSLKVQTTQKKSVSLQQPSGSVESSTEKPE